MRGKIVLAVTLLGLTGLSGCLGFGGDDTDDEHNHDECEGLEGAAHDECHDGEDPHGNDTDNDQNATPNEPPVAKLTMTDAEGNPLTNGSAIMVGQSVTFSANGSMDPDGELDLVALTVIDKNGSRTVSLVDNGELIDVTLPFESNGFLVATLRLLDNDGDAAAATDYAWVNLLQVKEGELVTPAPPEGPGPCAGLGGDNPIIDSTYSAAPSFSTFNGTRWISATSTDNVKIAICDPDGNKLSEGDPGQDVSTPDDTLGEGLYPPRVDYYVFVQAEDPEAVYTVEIIAHWEPKPTS